MGHVDANAPLLRSQRAVWEPNCAFESEGRTSSVLRRESQCMHGRHEVKPNNRLSRLLDALASIWEHQRNHLIRDRISLESV